MKLSIHNAGGDCYLKITSFLQHAHARPYLAIRDPHESQLVCNLLRLHSYAGRTKKVPPLMSLTQATLQSACRASVRSYVLG